MRPLLQLLRFVLKVQGAVVQGCRVLTDEGAVEIEVRRRRNAQARCPECRQPMTGRLVRKRRQWRHLDLMGNTTYLAAEVREGYCRSHGRRVERVPWAAPRAQCTRVFDRQVASLVQVADKSAAQRMFRIAWRTVGRIVTRVVGELLPKKRLQGLEYIGVDETSYKRGHRYLTVVSDLVTGRVVWLGEGKSAETLAGFFRELGQKGRRRIKLVAMDMSGAYKKAVQQHIPQADVVYDRFHVVKLLLDAIDEIRRDEMRRLKGRKRTAIKKTRYALLRNPKRHLSPRDRAAIERIRSSNRRLSRAYELRVDFEELWELEDEDDAREFLMNWTRAALRSRRPPLRKFATTVRSDMEGILGFFRWYGQTNSVLEGMNNKIKLAIHRAFGFRTVEALMSMVYLCCSGLTLGL